MYGSTMGPFIVLGRPEEAQFKIGWGAKSKRNELKRSILHKSVNYQLHCDVVDIQRCGGS